MKKLGRPRATVLTLLGVLFTLFLQSCGTPPARPAAKSGLTSTPSSAAAPMERPVQRPTDVYNPVTWDHSRAKVPVSPTDPIWGNPDAPVTIVGFADLECPFCARAALTIQRLAETYGPQKVRLVVRHNPLAFHKHAKDLAIAATVVHALGGCQAYYQFLLLAFENQGKLTDTSAVQWATASGVNPDQFREALASQRYASRVEDDMALAKSLGVTGTPVFFINGIRLPGAQPYEKFAELVDQQLDRARALAATGTPALDIYPALANENFGTLPPSTQTTAPDPDALAVWKIAVAKDDPILGPKDAPVTLVAFMDLQCPYCARVHGTLQQLRALYPQRLRIVWKDNPLPFHAQALPAAVLGRLVLERRGNDAFWNYGDRLLQAQPEAFEDELKSLAKEYGIPWREVENATQRGRVRGRIQDSMGLAYDFQARGTPHFFINGVRIAGAQPIEVFEEAIQREAAKVESLSVKGNQVYAAIMAQAREPEPPERLTPPPIEPGRPCLGPANAPIVIHEWSEFQCPFCARVQPTLSAIRDRYGSQVRIVWHHWPLPFHNNAQRAAEAAEEVFAQKGNEAFWSFAAKLFEAQSQPDGLNKQSLVDIAAQLGVDVAKLRAALEARTHQSRVDKDASTAKELGITGTPSFIVGGYRLSGAQPEAAFHRLIERAQKERRGGSGRR